MTLAISRLNFYRLLWERLTQEAFTVERLALCVKHDAGHDMNNLDEADIVALMEERYTGSWAEPAFSFSELMSYYSVLGAIKSPAQVVGWVFSAFVVAEGIRKDALDWELQINNILTGLVIVRDQLEAEELVEIVRQIFCG